MNTPRSLLPLRPRGPHHPLLALQEALVYLPSGSSYRPRQGGGMNIPCALLPLRTQRPSSPLLAGLDSYITRLLPRSPVVNVSDRSGQRARSGGRLHLVRFSPCAPGVCHPPSLLVDLQSLAINQLFKALMLSITIDFRAPPAGCNPVVGLQPAVVA